MKASKARPNAGDQADAAKAEDLPADTGAEVTQATPVTTGETRRDGLQIDGFGLPVNGIARANILDKLKHTGGDPLTEPDTWSDALTAKARSLTEKHYG